MRMWIAPSFFAGLLAVVVGCSSPTDPNDESDFAKVPTSVKIGGQSVELRTYATTETDDGGVAHLEVAVSLGVAPGLPGRVTGVSVDRLWISIDGTIHEVAVGTWVGIPESPPLWQAVDDIEWDHQGEVQVVARVRDDESGKQRLVRDEAVAIAHGDP